MRKSILLLVICALVCFGNVPRVTAQDADVNNARVVEMTKLGLDDDIVIAKIKSGKVSFQLADSDLLDLKKKGVSPKVIAAMLDATVLTSARVSIDKRVVEMHTLAQAKVGGRLGSAFTYGIKSVKSKAYLEGSHSSVIVSPSPRILVELPRDESIDSYILVALDGKKDRRELEVASVGGIVGKKSGIRAEAIQRTSSKPLGGNTFNLMTDTLRKGEYIIYVVGSADSIRGIYGRGYDFTVE